MNPALPLSGQTAVITGGLGDIGRATATALAAAGAQVALSDVLAPDRASALMPNFRYAQVDVTQRAQIDAWLDQVEVDLGSIVHVVANAGIVEFASALDDNDPAWDRTLAINLTGAARFAQAGARRMVASRQPGRIVLVGSWAAHAPHAGITAYSVAKAGLRMFTQCLALDVADHGIQVNEVAPGFVDGGLSGRAFNEIHNSRARAAETVPLRRLCTVEEVADQILWLCHPKNSHMTGSTVVMDGGLSLRRGPHSSS